MKELLVIAKALGDENRTRVMMFLRGGELCVCQIVEMLHLAPSTVSKHLNILHQAGLVETRKAGRWIYYRLPQKAAPGAAGAIKWLNASLARSPQARQDAKRLATVMKMDKEQLCCRYKG